jgi:hypothetical protein
MFYGLVVPAKKDTRVEGSSTNLIHISSISLNSKTPVSTNVYLKKNNEKFLIGVLDSQKQAQVAVDLYVLASDNVSFFSENGEVHVVGYYEPSEADVVLASKAHVHKSQPVPVQRKKSDPVDEEDLDDLDIKPKGPAQNKQQNNVPAKPAQQTAPQTVQKPQAPAQAQQKVTQAPNQTQQKAAVTAQKPQAPAQAQPQKAAAPKKPVEEDDEDLDELDEEDLEELDDEDLEGLDDDEEDDEEDLEDDDEDEDLDELEDDEEEEEEDDEDETPAPKKNGAVAKKPQVEDDEDDFEEDDEDLEEDDGEDDEDEQPLKKRPQGNIPNVKQHFNNGGERGGFRGSRGGNRDFRDGDRPERRGFRGGDRGEGRGFRGGDRRGGRGFRGGDRGGRGFRGGDRGGRGFRGGSRGGFNKHSQRN